jgi:hypothetical protein
MHVNGSNRLTQARLSDRASRVQRRLDLGLFWKAAIDRGAASSFPRQSTLKSKASLLWAIGTFQIEKSCPIKTRTLTSAGGGIECGANASRWRDPLQALSAWAAAIGWTQVVICSATSRGLRLRCPPSYTDASVKHADAGFATEQLSQLVMDLCDCHS